MISCNHESYSRYNKMAARTATIRRVVATIMALLALIFVPTAIRLVMLVANPTVPADSSVAAAVFVPVGALAGTLVAAMALIELGATVRLPRLRRTAFRTTRINL